MNEEKVIYEGEFNGNHLRIVEFYDTFFAHQAYKLQRKVKGFRFLFWTFKGWWTTMEYDRLATHYYKWAEHYKLAATLIPYAP